MQSLKDYYIESMLPQLDDRTDYGAIEEEYIAQLTALADKEVEGDRQ